MYSFVSPFSLLFPFFLRLELILFRANVCLPTFLGAPNFASLVAFLGYRTLLTQGMKPEKTKKEEEEEKTELSP